MNNIAYQLEMRFQQHSAFGIATVAALTGKYHYACSRGSYHRYCPPTPLTELLPQSLSLHQDPIAGAIRQPRSGQALVPPSLLMVDRVRGAPQHN